MELEHFEKQHCNRDSTTLGPKISIYANLILQMTSAPSEYTGGVAKTVSMFSKLMNQGSAIVVEGVKNFVLKENVKFKFF